MELPQLQFGKGANLSGRVQTEVVQRDLKPANIKITPEGKVKVLDSGLAKAIENAPTSAALSNSPTLLSAGGLQPGSSATNVESGFPCDTRQVPTGK